MGEGLGPGSGSVDDATSMAEQVPSNGDGDGDGDGVTDPRPTDTRLVRVPKDAIVLRRRRVVLVTAAIAAGSLFLGLVLAGRITSPREAAARTEPPEASNILAPVEMRELRSEIVTRGDVVYDEAIELTLDVSGMVDVAPVVTGRVPQAGDTVDAGTVVLEVSGRPVFVLPGEVPLYRAIHPDMRGPDVLQLKAALASLGLDPGNPDDDRFDARVASAIATLYENAGYLPPEADETAVSTLEAAEDAVESAEDILAAAQAALDALGEERPPEAVQARNDAREALGEAEDELAEAELAAGPWVPLTEIVFLPNLPRQVDKVNLERGDAVQGAVMELSGADLVVQASLNDTDVEFVTVGMEAVMEVGDTTFRGTVAEVREAEDAGSDSSGDSQGEPPQTNEDAGGGTAPDGDQAGQDPGASPASGQSRMIAVITPTDLPPELVGQVRGVNLRVTIPVQATAGEVLAVPLAAVTAGAGGESRVEVQQSDDDRTHLVEVKVGLSAEGYAEVTPVEGGLEVGDMVVVGR